MFNAMTITAILIHCIMAIEYHPILKISEIIRAAEEEVAYTRNPNFDVEL